MLSFLVFLCLIIPATYGVLYQGNGTHNKIVVYWGQDSAGTSHPDDLEKNLAYYCDLGDNYDVIIISFMIIFVDSRQPTCGVPNGPDLNFANHGNNCTTFPNCPFLLDCSTTIGPDITSCQSKNKKIMLSLGGASGAYDFTSDSEATSFATTIWDMFFEGTSDCRPFGDAILDGIDLDIEGGSPTGYGAFVSSLREKMSSSKNEYIISGAPQCVYPDAYLGNAIDVSGKDFSWLNVQFYNNYCGAFDTSEFYPAFEQWNEVAVKNDFQINVGLPASSSAGGGYISPSAACDLLPKLKTYDSFGGFMLWDASWDMTNNYYSESLRKCLG